MRNLFLSTFALLLLASVAHAEPGRTTDVTPLRTGPGTNFPVVVTLSSMEDVDISTCTNQWTWCEVQTQNKKQGWVMGSYLTLPFIGPVAEKGAQRGIPLVAYIQNNTPAVAPVYIPEHRVMTIYTAPGANTVIQPQVKSQLAPKDKTALDPNSVKTTISTTKTTSTTTVDTNQDSTNPTTK